MSREKKWKEKNAPRKRDVEKNHTDDTIDEIQFLVWNDWAPAVALQRGQGRRGTVLKKNGGTSLSQGRFLTRSQDRFLEGRMLLQARYFLLTEFLICEGIMKTCCNMVFGVFCIPVCRRTGRK